MLLKENEVISFHLLEKLLVMGKTPMQSEKIQTPEPEIPRLECPPLSLLFVKM